MKKIKGILSYVLAVLLLAACAVIPPDPTGTEGSKATGETEYIPHFATRPRPTLSDPATAEMNINCQYLPETVDNPDNLPVLKWVCLPEDRQGGKYGRVWNEEAAIELNQMLADRNMPFRVQFAIYTTDYYYANYYYTNMDWFVRPEVQMDLASADLLLAGLLSPECAADYFMPLTEYVTGNASPSLKNAVPHEINWQQSSVNGEIYGISQAIRRATTRGWRLNADTMAECELRVADFRKEFWEIDDVLKKINEVTGSKKLLPLSSQSTLGGTFDFKIGVESISPGIADEPMNAYFTEIGSIYAVEYVGDRPVVINKLDTETAHKIQEAVRRYKDKYAAEDNVSLLRYNTMSGHQSYQQAYARDNTVEWIIPLSTTSYNNSESAIMENVSGVAVNSKHQKEAVALLHLIAEDEEFRMQLMFGKEGRDYTINEQGVYSVTKQEDGSDYNMSFLSPWSYFGEMEGAGVQYPGTTAPLPRYEGMSALETYREMVENAEPYYAVPFDYSGLQEELIAVEQVCQLYFYRFASLTEEKYAEMLEKINAAGGEKIMTELQKQLDEWVKNNPGKPVTPNRS